MSFLTRQRQGASPQDRSSAQSYASVASEPSVSRSSRWARLFLRRRRVTPSQSSAAGDAPLALLTLSSHSQSRDLSEPSPGRPVRQDYSVYHTQTPPGPGSPPRDWNSTGPLPSLRHRGRLITRASMTSDNTTWEAEADDANVDTTPKRQTGSVELRRRTARALNHTPTHSLTLFGPANDPYSEAVADWNIGHHDQKELAASRASLDTSQGRPRLRETGRKRSHSLNHKRDISNLRDLSTVSHQTGPTTADMGFLRRSHDKERKLKSSQKPLPAVPIWESMHSRNLSQQSSTSQESRSDHVRDVAVAQKDEARRPHDSGIHSELGRERGYLVRDAEHPVDLTGIVDLSNTEDTDVTVKYAPAVTHETVTVKHREIVQEQITREIHNHHVYHRILPVLDFEVLPARHFVPAADGGLTEISEDQIPGGAMGQDLQRVIADAISNMMPRAQHPVAPRQFTARKFEGTEGDYKEWVGEDGIKRTEQWWVHPPTLETDSTWGGQARDFHFDSEQDGFRDPVLDGSSSGRRHLRHGSLDQRFPPPRGASLGKTFVAGPADPAGHTVLPIRMAHGSGNKTATHPAVGVAL